MFKSEFDIDITLSIFHSQTNCLKTQFRSIYPAVLYFIRFDGIVNLLLFQNAISFNRGYGCQLDSRHKNEPVKFVFHSD